MFSSISNGQELKRKQPTTSHKTWLVVIREAFKVENILDRSDLRHTKHLLLQYLVLRKIPMSITNINFKFGAFPSQEFYNNFFKCSRKWIQTSEIMSCEMFGYLKYPSLRPSPNAGKYLFYIYDVFFETWNFSEIGGKVITWYISPILSISDHQLNLLILSVSAESFLNICVILTIIIILSAKRKWRNDRNSYEGKGYDNSSGTRNSSAEIL